MSISISDLNSSSLFNYYNYDILTTISVKDMLVAPEITYINTIQDTNDIRNIIRKLNKTIECTSESLLYPLNTKTEYINKTYEAIYGDNLYIKDIYKLVPVIVKIRDINGIKHLQTKTVDRVLTEDEYNSLLTVMTTKIDIIEHNPLLEKDDVFYRPGDYYFLTIPAQYLFNLNIPTDEILALDVDYDNYGYLFIELPLFLLPTISSINGFLTVGSINTTEKEWLPINTIYDILNSDINNIKSHVIRKFIYDVKNAMIYVAEMFPTYDNIQVINYLTRRWTDDIRYRINEEFPDTLDVTKPIMTTFRKLAILIKKSEVNINTNIANDIVYSADKSFLLSMIDRQIKEL